jgi:ubiquinone/menaquinone biosynthesis C-methylase UbiE
MPTTRMTTAHTKNYVFNNAAQQAGARFEAISRIFDLSTIHHLEGRGVDTGWHCLEVGAGNGSIAVWLSRRVGVTGHVLATDIDPRFLDSTKLPNMEVGCHDIVADELPEAAFDLAHCRLVLLHLSERENALRRMISALKPGGWLLAEEFDSASLPADPGVNPAEVLSGAQVAMTRLLDDRGADRRYGRLLLGQLQGHGLVEVDTEARMSLWQGGSWGASLLRANYEQLRTELINAGYITKEEFERDLARLERPDFLTPSPIMWTVWGRRPVA